MFGIGTTELIILLAILVLLFGSSKLPRLGAGIGEGIRNFKKAMKDPEAIDVTPKKEDENKAGDLAQKSHVMNQDRGDITEKGGKA